MKRLSSKRAKACAISPKVKKTVYERDNGLCVVCGRPGNPEAHVIPRSKGGKGIETNIVTMCRRCHRLYDQGDADEMEYIDEVVKGYLRDTYGEWSEEDQYYRKYED